MATFKIGFILLSFFIARLQGWKGLGGFGLPLKNNWVLKLVSGIFIGCFFFASSVLISILLGYELIEGNLSYSVILSKLPLILFMTAIPSIAEDILTRGYLYGHLKFLKPILWVFLSALIYLLNHIWRLNDGFPVLTYLFVFGIVLAVAVRITGSLWLAFGIHWGANIAFEVSSLIPKSETISFPGVSNWILAMCWGILLLLMMLFNFIKEKSQQLTDNSRVLNDQKI